MKHGFTRWRVGICGFSHNLPAGAGMLCNAIGEAMSRHGTVTLVQSGLRRRRDDTRGMAADWHFLEGFRGALGTEAADRVETIIADVDQDADAEIEAFGQVRRVRGRTREARRFAFVRSLDAMIAVGGGYGTLQQLTLASALDLPIAPVPCHGGSAARFWHEHRVDLVQRLGIDAAAASAWERMPADEESARGLATQVVDAVVRRLPRRAFVIMPFAERFDTLYELVLQPVFENRGVEALRLDRAGLTGNALEQIERGIEACDWVVAVLDGLRPNVMFELGLARALRKPALLILRRPDGAAADEIPFDIAPYQRIEYQQPDRTLVERLDAAIATLVRREMPGRDGFDGGSLRRWR